MKPCRKIRARRAWYRVNELQYLADELDMLDPDRQLAVYNPNFDADAKKKRKELKEAG